MLFFSFILTQSCKKPGCTDPNATNYNPSANTDDFSCEYDSASTFELIWEVNHMFRNDSFSYFTDYFDDSNNLIQFSRISMYVGKTQYGKNGEFNYSNEAYVLINPDETQYNFGSIEDTSINTFQSLIGVDSITNHLDPALYNSSNPLSYQTPSMHWQMGTDPQNWSYLFLVMEGFVDMNQNSLFEAGEYFVYHIGGDEFINNTNTINFNPTINSSNDFIIQLEIDWSEAINGINMSTDNFTHTMDNIPLAQNLVANCVNLIEAN